MSSLSSPVIMLLLKL
ncbi:unnamed protein product, partial [Rotaria sordida]